MRAALGHIDAVEALRQPRQVLGCNSRTVIAHRHARFRLAIRPLAPGQLELHPLARGGIFQRVLHEIFEDADQFVAITAHHQRIRAAGGLHFDAAVTRQSLQRIADLSHDRAELDLLLRPQMRIERITNSNHSLSRSLPLVIREPAPYLRFGKVHS